MKPQIKAVICTLLTLGALIGLGIWGSHYPLIALKIFGIIFILFIVGGISTIMYFNFLRCFDKSIKRSNDDDTGPK